MKAGKTPGKQKKDVKMERAKPVSLLESTNVSKNKLKTNWFLSARMAKQTQKTAQKPSFCTPSQQDLRVAMHSRLGECAMRARLEEGRPEGRRYNGPERTHA